MTKIGRFAIACLSASIVIGSAPGLEAASKLVQCQTITAPGSYVLAKTLTVVGTCFVIGADFVTIDLDGEALVGNGTGEGITDGGATRSGVVVRNGIVSNFATGVNIGHSTGSVVEKIRALGNATDGIVVGAFPLTRRGNAVTGSVARGNGGNGINGLFSTGTRATDNTVNDNGQHGMRLNEESVVTGNEVSNNAGTGISSGQHSTIARNAASRNGGDGIFSANSSITGNAANANGGRGIVGGSATIVGNTANNNAGDGIHGVIGDVIRENTATGNGGHGIVVGGGFTPGNGSTIIANITYANGGSGINVGAGPSFATGSTVSGNTANGNGVHGIHVRCPSNVFDNTAIENTMTNLERNESDGLCMESNNLAP